MSELIHSNKELDALLCADFIEKIEDNSCERLPMQRARVTFKNGHTLSIIRGPGSFGGDEGLFEIMPDDEYFFEDDDKGDQVLGHLTPERLAHYINKIGSAPRKEAQE